MNNMLQQAINRNGKAAEVSLGVMLPAFMKNLKDNVCKNLSDDEQMPHPMAFYFHIFQSAHHLVFSAARGGLSNNSNKFYRDLLENDFPKFCCFALQLHAEKNENKYTAQIEFASKYPLTVPEEIELPKQVVKREPLPMAKPEPAIVHVERINKPKEEVYTLKKSVTVLVAPSMTFDLAYLEELKSSYNVVCAGTKEQTSDKFWSKVGSAKTKRDLFVMSNFDGLVNADKRVMIERLLVLKMTSEATMKNFY
jgi:hypothetical protein